MVTDHSPTLDFPARETQTDQKPQSKETENETRKDVTYKLKEIQFDGRTTNIILQNENGPCPLIAICNILLLRNNTTLYPDRFEVSQKRLLEILTDALKDSNTSSDSDGEDYFENRKQNVSDAIERLPCLAHGINVNIKFRRIDDFEFTPELAIFVLLRIPLYHGWIVDPQDTETANAIECKSYNALTTELAALDHSVDFSAAITATRGVPSQHCSKAISFADSPPPEPAEHRRMRKGDYEEELLLLEALLLSEREAIGFDTRRDSRSEGELVSEFSDENETSDDDALVTSVDAAGDDISQQSKSNETDCDVGNKINVGEEERSTTSTTKCSGALDHDQLSSKELGDDVDVETENSSKTTYVHLTSSDEKTNLESTNNDSSSETPLKSEAVTLVNPDLSGRSQDDDDEAEECVNFSSPVYEGESLLGESSSEGKDANGIMPKESEVIRSFLNDNASQLTVYGLFCLKQDLEENKLCVFFRNNHFSTMLKYDNELYLLVTDQGYLTHRDVVWEKLFEVNGDSVFMTDDFEVYKSRDSSERRKWDQLNAISNTADYIFRVNNSLSEEGLEIDYDLKMAMELQQQELGGGSDTEAFLYTL